MLEVSLTETWGRRKSTGQSYFFDLDKYRDWGEEESLVDIYRASETF